MSVEQQYRTEAVRDRQPEALPSVQRISRISLWSVFKVSLAFYVIAGMALVIAAVLLSFASSASGLSNHLEHLGRTVFDLKSLPLGPAAVAMVSAVIAGVLAVAGTAINVLAAHWYNRIAHLVGGIRLTSGPVT